MGLFGGGTTISTEEPRIGALRIQQSAYGVAVPIVWGTTRISGNLIWYGDFTATAHTTTESSGGKGGGGVTQTNTTYTYTTAAAFGLCEGLCNGIGQVWSGKDKSSLSSLGLTIFPGTYPQTPWGYLTTNHPGEALGYSGLAYVAGVLFLGSGAQLPNLSFEVYGQRPFGAGSWDSNPRYVVDDILSNPYYGACPSGFPLADLTSYSTYCVANGLLLSPALIEQQETRQHLSAIFQATNSAPVWSEGVLKIVPYADGYASGNGSNYFPYVTPVYDLTDDDFMPNSGDDPVVCRRKPTADAYNHVQVEYLDRANGYNPAIAEAKDQANIEEYGLRTLDPVKLHCICETTVAQFVASAILQRATYIRNEYEFNLGWRYCLLEPMDIVSITDSALGLSRALVRIKEVEENEDGLLRVIAEEFPFGVATPAQFTVPTSGGYTVDLNKAPGNANAPVIFEPPTTLSGDPQVWLATSGGADWGGTEVWLSLDNATYKQIGTMHGGARHGTLTSVLASGSDPDTTHTLSVDLSVSKGTLIGGTTLDRDMYNTLAYVDGELVSFQNATLTAANRYDLTSLRRGAYGTPIGSHAIGTKFARLDQAIFKYTYDPALVGQTVYIKLRSFNTYGAAPQELATLTPTAYTIQGAPLGTVTGLALAQPFTGRSCSIKWNSMEGSSSYKVEVYAGAVLKRTVNNVASCFFEYSFEDSKADGGPYRSLEFRVYAISANGVSGSPAVLVANNPQVSAPTGVTAQAAGQSITVSANMPADTDYAGTKVWMSTTSGFDPSVTTPAYIGVSNAFTAMGLTGGQAYYFRMAHYDVFGQDSLNISSEFSATPLSPGGIPKVTSLPTYSGDPAVFMDVAEGSGQRGLWGWDGSAWQYTRNGAYLVANSVTADKISVANLGAISANLGTITAGNMTLDASGFVRGGSTGYLTGAGFWMGYHSTAYKMHIGDPTGDYMAWTGSALNIKGTINGGSININNLFTVSSTGQASIKSATSGARLEIANNVIKVYDASNVLRVRIGDLTA